MSSTSDTLLALRQAIKDKTPITYVANGEPTSALKSASHIALSPSLTLPKSTPTRLRKPGPSTSNDPASAPHEFFSLEAVYLAWHLQSAPGADYMKQARENGLSVGFVSVTERKSVVDWLEGNIADLPQIVSLSAVSGAQSSGVAPTEHIASTAATSSPSKRKYVKDVHDLEVVKKIKQNEIELQNRTTILRGSKPGNFSALQATYLVKLKKIKETSKSGAPPTPAPTVADPKAAARKSRNLFPIIIISSSPTALITMHNVKRFLQEATFETPQEARQRAASEGNPRPEDMIPIYRKRTQIDSSGKETETHTRYAVVDSVEALSKFGQDAWDRVVCVMTTGQAWQFRPYKWNEPRQLFHHVKGFYVAWANDPPNTKIQDWNVTELKIDPHRRHVDKSVVAHFWKTLDMWTLSNKPWLLKT